jgi:hypothetical protein
VGTANASAADAIAQQRLVDGGDDAGVDVRLSKPGTRINASGRSPQAAHMARLSAAGLLTAIRADGGGFAAAGITPERAHEHRHAGIPTRFGASVLILPDQRQRLRSLPDGAGRHAGGRATA